MPLSTTNMVLNGQIAHQDIKQYADLLTGVMTDQPVTITNTLTATTHIGNGTVPTGGASGQVLTKSAAANYNLTWTTPFSQANADALYQTPAQAAALYLPLVGGTLSGNLLFTADNARDIGAVAATRPRTVYAATSFIGPGAVPVGGTANQVLQKNTATAYDVGWITLPVGFTQVQADARYLQLTGGTLSGALHIGSANETIRNPVNAAGNLSIESADGNVLLGGAQSTQAVYNGYFDGTNWQRFNTANPYTAVWVGPSYVQFFFAAAGANPVTGVVSKFSVDNGGNGLFQGTLAAMGQLTANANLAVGGNINLNPTSQINFNNGAYITQYTSGSDVRVMISGLTVTPGPTATGVLAVNGTCTFNGDAHVGTGHNFYMDAGILYMGNNDIQFGRTFYGVNNQGYITNSAANSWSVANDLNTYGNLSSGGNLSCGAALNVATNVGISGIYLTLNQTNGNPYGIISTGGGDLYIRSYSGNIRFDSGPIFPTAVVSSIIYFYAYQSFPYIQQASSISIRYMCGPGGVHSFEANGGNSGYGTLNAYAYVSNGARFYSDGVTSIYTLAGQTSAHYFMSAGQAIWASCYAAAFTVNSTRASKANIRRLEDPLQFVLNDDLHCVRYTERGTGNAKVGFIADDWHAVLPEVIGFDTAGQILTLDYDRLNAVTFEALKQYVFKTDARLQALEARLAA